MIKTLRKNVFLLFIVLCTIILSAFIINKNITYNKDHDVNLRTVTLEENQVNAESYFEAFDEYEITTEDLTTTFDGVSTFNLSDFDDIDNISDGDVGESISIRYRSSFDYETGITTLTVLLVGEEDYELVDTVYGLALMDTETGEVDIAFDFDGETIFLSELRNAGLLDEVGWFKDAVKKVANKVQTKISETVDNVVSTAKSAVKVLKTNSGLIGSICTVAACAVVGAACSWIPGGQIVTVGCAALAGTVIGGIGFKLSAQAAQKEDLSITDEDISNYTNLGQKVGATVAVCSCVAMTNIRSSISQKNGNVVSDEDSSNNRNIKSDFDNLKDDYEDFKEKFSSNETSAKNYLLELADNNPSSNEVVIGKFVTDDGSTGYVDLGKKMNANYYSMDSDIWDQYYKEYGSDFMTDVNKKFITDKFNEGKTFYTAQDPRKVWTGDYAKELQWLQDLCSSQGKTGIWEKVGTSLWKFIVH